MAVSPTVVNDIILCRVILLLLYVSPSLQNCPQTFPDYAYSEGPGSKGNVLFTDSSITDLRLDNSDDGYLAINETTTGSGARLFTLYIAKALDLEAKNDGINGRVTCFDSRVPTGVPYNIRVTINGVNEYSPEFIDPPYSVNVTENTKVGTSIFSFSGRAIDKDFEVSPVYIVYSIGSVSPPAFSIPNSRSGDVTVTAELDYEKGPTLYTLHIAAAERQGSAPLTSYTVLKIHILDVDDVGPVFSHNATYSLSIAEGSYQGDVLTAQPPISAVDGDSLNADILLILDPTSSSLADRFSVLDNGSIQITGDMQPGQYLLNIRAYQANRPLDRFAIASLQVTVVDTNNNRPRMSNSSYSGTVLEGAAAGTVVLAVSASDLDQGINGSFLFHLNDSHVPFTITTSQTVGILVVTGPIDREKQEAYVLFVYAQENLSAEKRSSDLSRIDIIVIDVNDNSPVFQGAPYTFSVNETEREGFIVGKVTATDADKALNDAATVSYTITSSDNGAQAFYVDLNSGVIALSRNLTQDDIGVVYLDVKAEDRASDVKERRSQSTQVTIHILAVNQYPPTFALNSYDFHVPETAQDGLSLGEVAATDDDNDSLDYSLEYAGTEFKLQGNPPSLVVNASLDLDTPGGPPPRKYVFQVAVSDALHTVTVPVTVHVTPVNEYPPVFLQSVYMESVPENATLGYSVVQLNATDEDYGQDGAFTFNISSVDSGPFSLDTTSGLLTLACNACLDYNVQKRYTLVVKATDEGVPPRYSFGTVIVKVRDVNNKVPRFATTLITGSVPEDAKVGTTILQLQAMDDDTPFLGLTFTIENASPPGWLRVAGSSLLTADHLDAETHRFVTGTVRVSDGIYSNTTAFNITIKDVNDNYPQISLHPSTVEIPENATKGDEVPVEVSAQDLDVSPSHFFYYLGSAPSGKFAINSSTGEITVNGAFDRRQQAEYTVTVSVSDEASPPRRNSSELRVVITDSNSAPYFVDTFSNSSVTSYAFNVSENSVLGVELGQVRALDPDSGSSGQVSYSIRSGNDHGTFRIDPATGELILMKTVDYEGTHRIYSLVVRASDHSLEPKWTTAVVKVTVDDVVEAPQWPESLPRILLTKDEQCSDVQLDAEPRDVLQASSSSPSGVLYSLLNNTDRFSINNETGLLQLKGSLVVGEYHIGLRACSSEDLSVCSDALLAVDVRAGDVITFCPPFLTVSVNESAKTGDEVTDLTSTKGDNNVTYSLHDAALLPFVVNTSTGLISISGALDRETVSRYTIEVVGVYNPSNGSATAQVTVLIEDAADSAPRFRLPRYEGEVREEVAAGSPVLTTAGALPLRLTADDADLNPTLTYSIEADKDNSNGSFAVNSTTGELTVAKVIDLDVMPVELKGRYTFEVMVSDGSQNDNTTVVVHVLNINDNSPVFVPSEFNFTVSEAADPIYRVGTLHARDADADDNGRLTYSMLNPKESLPFRLSDSGQLMLNRSLDRETQDFYTLSVVVRDHGGRNDTADVIVSVLDANEPPVFDNVTYTMHVTEGQKGVKTSIAISATDSDLGNNAILTFRIQSGNKNGAFRIADLGNTTAILEVVSELDREETPTLTLVVTATDGGQSPLTATCTVDVIVDDINDHPPVFGSSNYTAQIREGAENNTRIRLFPPLVVSDPDSGDFGRGGVVFSLADQGSAPFRVDSVTCSLFVFLSNNTDSLDREAKPRYTLTLMAMDTLGTGLNGTATVHVMLTNVNDHVPVFQQRHYDFSVSEDVGLQYVITTFIATDSDNDTHGIRYYIHPPGGEGKFFLDPVSGKLLVSGLLDREVKESYHLSLGAFDGELWGNATATVTVDDVNDNCPVFHVDKPLTLTVLENTQPDVIYVFNVTDSDAGNNGNVTLSINGTDADIYLQLTPDGGLRTKQTLDREKDDQKTLTFTAWAKDGGSPPCVTSLQVQVDVQGANEVAPQVCHITRQQQPICGLNISLSVFDEAAEGTFLAALSWRDTDDGEGGQAVLSLTSNPDGLLTLNQTSADISVLTLAKPLSAQDLEAKGLMGNDSVLVATVTAVDKGKQPKQGTATLSLRVMELLPTTPVFDSSVYNFSVTENHPVTVIGRVRATTTSQEEQMTYTLQSAPHFQVDSQGNVSTAVSLDRETTDMYTFLVIALDTLQASETATAVILVMVLDENDNSPVFSASAYDVTVPENVADKELLDLVATDNDAGDNGRVSFYLFNESLGHIFVLNSSSGQLWLNHSLDREQDSSYTLLVEASDNGSPAKVTTATVHVTVQDVNDNAPKFTQETYVGYLDENSPAATQVLNVSAGDVDSGLNGQVLYDLLTTDQTVGADFYINHFSKRMFRSIFVRPRIFSGFNLHLYRLLSVSYLSIGHAAGTIYSSRSFQHTTEQSFNLTVRARDLGNPPKTTSVGVSVYVNDLSSVLPRVTFDPEIVALVLGTAPGALVPVNVSAGVPNCNFSIVEGGHGLFAIDADSGKVTVTTELAQAGSYQLTIRAVNKEAVQYFADGKLAVTVTSVRLEQERYAAVVTENWQAPPAFQILDVNSNAERAGIPVTYTLTSTAEAGVFFITRGTGQLFCNRTLDRERKSQYLLQVTVRLTYSPTRGRAKRDLSNTAEVVIIVDDVNDNIPRFDVTSNVFGISESATANTVVTTLKASDPDSGTNGEVIYRATGGNTDVFTVTSTGMVTSLVSMADRAEAGPFTLSVEAVDRNGAGQAREITIQIVVVPNDDRFGLVANITVDQFIENQQHYLRNLSDILNMTVQMDRVEPHQDTVVDTSKSDIYFYAFDSNKEPVPFSVIGERVKANSSAINALFNSKGVRLIAVTETPTRVRVETRYEMGEAEIAVIVVACLIFLGSFVAILLTIRAWRKQKELQEREEAATRARQRLEQESRELADKLQETSFVADPDEPLELDMDPEDEGRVFNPRMFLKNMRESEPGSSDRRRRRQRVEGSKEDGQTTVVVLAGQAARGLDSLAVRRSLLPEATPRALDALLEVDDGQYDGLADSSNTEADSGTENNGGSLSSDDVQLHGQEGRTPPSEEEEGGGGEEGSVDGAASHSNETESLESSSVRLSMSDPTVPMPDPDSGVRASASAQEAERLADGGFSSSSSFAVKAALTAVSVINETEVVTVAEERDSIGARNAMDIQILSNPNKTIINVTQPASTSSKQRVAWGEAAVPERQRGVTFSSLVDERPHRGESHSLGEQKTETVASNRSRQIAPVESASRTLAEVLMEEDRAYNNKDIKNKTKVNAQAFVNSAFEEEAEEETSRNGWHPDYETQDVTSVIMSTAL